MEGIKKAMNERNLNEGQWEDRKQWSLGVGHFNLLFHIASVFDTTLLNYVHSMLQLSHIHYFQKDSKCTAVTVLVLRECRCTSTV